jgi:hypothetical protein
MRAIAICQLNPIGARALTSLTHGVRYRFFPSFSRRGKHQFLPLSALQAEGKGSIVKVENKNKFVNSVNSVYALSSKGQFIALMQRQTL